MLVSVLNLFGIQTASLIAVLGAAGLAVGLAMQGTLSNFAAGVMLLVFRPFKLGDYVAVAGVAGTVQEIGVFSTTLHTPDNVRITVSNASIYGDTIQNYSANETRRNDLVIGISYGDDIGRALDRAAQPEQWHARHAQAGPELAEVAAAGSLANRAAKYSKRSYVLAATSRARLVPKSRG